MTTSFAILRRTPYSRAALHTLPEASMPKHTVSRREFVGIGASVAGATLIGEPILPGSSHVAHAAATAAPSDRVRFGMIGIGMQGSGLLATAIRLPNVE